MAGVQEVHVTAPLGDEPALRRVPATARHHARLPVQMIGLGGLLTVSVLLAAATGTVVGIWAPVAAIVLDTAMAVALASIAAMTWVRFREHGPLRPLYQSSAFAVLAVGGLVRLAVITGGPGRDLGGALDAWATVQWIIAGTLLLLSAGPAADGAALRRAPAWLVAAGPAVASVGVAALLLLVSGPDAGAPVERLLALPPGPGGGVLPDTGLLHALTHVPGVLLLAAAAIGYRRLHAQAPNASRAWLAIGLVWAAGGQAFAALLPGRTPLDLTAGDLCVALFIGCSMAGIVAASQDNLRSLRAAYEELSRARDEEIRRVAFAERARLARDIHDHLIQSLWLARLRQGHVLETELPEESRLLAEEVCRALDDGLADAREAMVALEVGPDGPRPIHVVLQDGLGRLAERYDLELRLFRSGPMPSVGPAAAAQLLGIAREAVTNAAKHADATMVRVRLIASDRELVVTVADNGNGFDPGAAHHGFGLGTMERRAAAIGARLVIDSRPMDGTRVTLTVPLGPEVAR